MTDHDQAPREMGEDDGYGFALMARLNEVTMRLKGEWGDPVAWIANTGDVPAPVRSVVRRHGLRHVLPEPEDEAIFFEGFVAGVRKFVDQLEERRAA